MTLALLATFRNIVIALAIAGLLLWLEGRSERKHAAQVERQDLEDFATYVADLYAQDWEWPARPVTPPAEYVAKPKARVR